MTEEREWHKPKVTKKHIIFWLSGKEHKIERKKLQTNRARKKLRKVT